MKSNFSGLDSYFTNVEVSFPRLRVTVKTNLRGLDSYRRKRPDGVVE